MKKLLVTLIIAGAFGAMNAATDAGVAPTADPFIGPIQQFLTAEGKVAAARSRASAVDAASDADTVPGVDLANVSADATTDTALDATDTDALSLDDR